MNIKQLRDILNKYENKELPMTMTGNNSFSVDITDSNLVGDEKILLLYENSYNTKTGKHLLNPIKTIGELLVIIDSIEDKSLQIKGRGTNGVLVSPTDCRICYIDNCAMVDLYDRSQPITIDKAKEDAQIFIDNLHID